MIRIFETVKRFFGGYKKGPLFKALDQYLETSNKEMAKTISRPRKKSKFLAAYDNYLGLD